MLYSNPCQYQVRNKPNLNMFYVECLSIFGILQDKIYFKVNLCIEYKHKNKILQTFFEINHYYSSHLAEKKLKFIIPKILSRV